MQTDSTYKARCRKQKMGTGLSVMKQPPLFQKNTYLLYTMTRKKLKHKQDNKFVQHLQILVQTIAFKISECNFIRSLKFCFLIWFINDMRQKLSSCVYKVASAPRNPDLFGTLDLTKSLKKRKNLPKSNYVYYTSQHNSSGTHETKCWIWSTVVFI